MRKRASTVSNRPRQTDAGARGLKSRASRSSRLTRSRRSRRRRQAGAILFAGLVLAIILFIAIWLGRAGDEVEVAVEPAGESVSANILLVGTGDQGALNQLLVAVAEDEGGYSLITIPARTIAEAPGSGFLQMERIMEAGGRELLQQSLAGLLQIPIDHYMEFDQRSLETAAAKADIINFSTDKPLSTAGGEVTLAAGDNLTSPDTALSHLKSSSADSTDGPLIQALFYRGLRDALTQLPEQERQALAEELSRLLKSDLSEQEIVSLFMSMTTAGQPFGVWPLPVVKAGEGGEWYLEPVPDQLEALLQGSSRDSAIKVEIQNGTETPGLVEAAAAKLAPLRYNIVQNTELSEVNYDHTQVRCGSEVLAECERISDSLGAGTLIKDEYLEKQLIIVIIGRDLGPADLE